MDCLYREVFGAGFFIGALIGLLGYILHSVLFAERSIKERSQEILVKKRW